MINAIVIDQVNYVNTGLTDDFLLNHKGAKYLSVWDTSITKIPASIVDLTELKTFNLSGCANLKELPDLSKPKQLTKLNLSRCASLSTLPELPNNLERLYLSGCANLKELPDLSKFVQLKRLYLSGCDKLEFTPELKKILSALEEGRCKVHYPDHFNPKIFTQIAEDRLLKVIKRYNGQENSEPSEIIPVQDESQGIKKLFNRFLTEKVDVRSNKISSMAKALELTESAEPFLNFIEKEENLRNLSWINKLADNYLVACINQPVLGFFVINSFIDIAEKEKFSDKVMSAKPLFALAGINEIIAGNRLGEEVQAEAGNVLLIELHKQLLNEKIIQEPWLGVPTKIAYAETVKSFVEKEGVKSALTELKTKIINLTTEQCVDLLCSPSGIDNQHQNAWAETAFPKNKEIKEIKDTFTRKYDEALNSNQPSNSDKDSTEDEEMKKYEILKGLTASKDADITNKIVELTKIELEKEGKVAELQASPAVSSIRKRGAEELVKNLEKSSKKSRE